MRALPWILSIVAVVGMTVGQPLCCVVGTCCGQVKAEEARRDVARGPRGVEVPCCKRCAANLEHETESPREPRSPEEPGSPREKCECAKKLVHLTQTGDETVALGAGTVALPFVHEAAAPAPTAVCLVARTGHSPPGVVAALSLPLLL